MTAMITDSRAPSAQLPSGHADRTEHAELTGALVHRERQRVDDAEDRDDLGEQQERDEHREELVDRPLLLVVVLAPG